LLQAREDAGLRLNQFIADCRTILHAILALPAANRCVNLERLLGNKISSRNSSDAVPRGLKVLYEDPKLGFQVLAHINDKARVSPPMTTRVMGHLRQATKYTDMTEWKRRRRKDPKHAKPAGEEVWLRRGSTRRRHPLIDYPDYARFVRVTGTNLDKIDRIKID
jgi:hypothetical protein